MCRYTVDTYRFTRRKRCQIPLKVHFLGFEIELDIRRRKNPFFPPPSFHSFAFYPWKTSGFFSENRLVLSEYSLLFTGNFSSISRKKFERRSFSFFSNKFRTFSDQQLAKHFQIIVAWGTLSFLSRVWWIFIRDLFLSHGQRKIKSSSIQVAVNSFTDDVNASLDTRERELLSHQHLTLWGETILSLCYLAISGTL